MDITEKQVYEALGVSAPGEKEGKAAEGPKDAEKTESATIGTDGEENRSEELNNGTEPEEADAQPTAEGGDTVGEGQDGVQSLEERRENAARRRRAERDKAIGDAVSRALAAEREKTKAEQAAFFSSAGLVNTVTGEPITDMDGYRKWQADYKSASAGKKLEKSGIDKETIEKIIEESPAMKRANAIIAREEAAVSAKAKEEAKARMEADIAYIARFEPKVKTVSDLAEIENYELFADYVRKGNTFADAYILANRDKVTGATAKAAASAAEAKSAGKSHMTKIGSSRGSGAEPVPKDEYAMFKLLLPEASDDQIAAYYNKYKKSKE